MRSMLFAALTALLIAAPASAFELNRNIAAQPAGLYLADPAHTSVVWRVSHMGLSLYTGRFNDLAATLTLNPDAPALSELSVEIPVASIDTGHRDERGEAGFDQTLARRLGANAHPNITFRATSIEPVSEHTGLIHGDLSLNGVTRPVTLEAVFNGGRFVWLTQAHTLGFSAHARINRSEFGIDAWSAFVGDEVEVLIEAEFQRR